MPVATATSTQPAPSHRSIAPSEAQDALAAPATRSSPRTTTPARGRPSASPPATPTPTVTGPPGGSVAGRSSGGDAHDPPSPGSVEDAVVPVSTPSSPASIDGRDGS